MIKQYLLLLLLFSCTDILVNKQEYQSIELSGTGWIEINQGTDFNANNFTLQSWFSGLDTNAGDAETIFSMLNSSGEILIGVFKDPTYQNRLDIWINNENASTVEISDKLNDSDTFNLLTLKGGVSEIDPAFISISLFINKINIYNQATTLTTEDLANINFIIGAKANTEHTYLDRFWNGYIDEIRLWNTTLSDTLIEYHNDYPYKLSFQSDSLTYINSLGHLSGLWRFYTSEEAYSTIPNNACPTIQRLYNDNPCSTDAEAIIYTLGDYTVQFSEKHK